MSARRWCDEHRTYDECPGAYERAESTPYRYQSVNHDRVVAETTERVLRHRISELEAQVLRMTEMLGASIQPPSISVQVKQLSDEMLLRFSGWRPTPEGVNALPEPLRRYIHDLETLLRCPQCVRHACSEHG